MVFPYNRVSVGYFYLTSIELLLYKNRNFSFSRPPTNCTRDVGTFIHRPPLFATALLLSVTFRYRYRHEHRFPPAVSQNLLIVTRPFSVSFQINEISVIQNVNSNVNNRILSGFGNFGGGGGSFPGGDMMKPEPGGTAADNKQMPSPPSHHIRTPPLWDLHYDRQSAVNIKSSPDDHQLNNCAPQSPRSSPIAHANHISQNRTEGLAT
jgi:hypothetical protein